MSGRWQDLDSAGKEVARTIFDALETAHGLSDGGATPRPSASAIWSALTTGRALPAGLTSDADLEAMLAAAATIVFPRRAAAATPPASRRGETSRDAAEGDAVIDRSTEGARVRLVPSRRPSTQSYLVISFEDPLATASRLLMLVAGAAPIEIALPPPVGGTIQLLVDNADPSLAVLADEDARLFLL